MWTRDEPDIGDRPAMIQRLVEVAAINGHDGARCKGELLSDAHIVGIAIDHERPAG